jgi:hypothetical protein
VSDIVEGLGCVWSSGARIMSIVRNVETEAALQHATRGSYVSVIMWTLPGCSICSDALVAYEQLSTTPLVSTAHYYQAPAMLSPTIVDNVPTWEVWRRGRALGRALSIQATMELVERALCATVVPLTGN